MTSPMEHLAALAETVMRMDTRRLVAWGTELGAVLTAGGRLLVAGNGGAAATAQHLTAELVGRFRRDRRALSAIALHADTSSVTAIGNDFGFDEVFARQVSAHGRDGDVLLTMSTSGESRNLLRAVDVARSLRMRTWAMTGEAPNPLRQVSDEALAVPARSAATVQECHLAAVHAICHLVDEALARADAAAVTGAVQVGVR
jgi:phosphoheptose isomerase